MLSKVYSRLCEGGDMPTTVASTMANTGDGEPQQQIPKKAGKPKKHVTKGFSAIFSTGSANPNYIGRYKPVTIIGVIVIASPVDRNKLIGVLKERVLPKYPRLRAVARRQAAEAMAFEEIAVEEMDWAYHVNVEPSSGANCKPWSQELLNDFLSDLYGGAKDISKPLFRFHLIDNMADGSSVMILNVDHAVGDGISMIGLLMSLYDEGKVVVPRAPCAKRPAKPSVFQKLHGLVHGVVMALAMPICPADPPSNLKLTDMWTVSTERAFSRAEKIPLERVKEVSKQLPGTTVNDVLAAVLNLAIIKYLEEIKDPILKSGKSIRANFPVSLRKAGKADGNEIATSLLTYKLKHPTRESAVWDIKHQVDVIKVSPQPLLEYYLIRLIARVLPKILLMDVSLFLFGKFTLMLSNVPGPQTKQHLFGATVLDMYYYLFSPIGVYCGMISYDGQVTFTVASDPVAEDKPERLSNHFITEFDALHKEVTAGPIRKPPPHPRMSGWFWIGCTAALVVAALAAKSNSKW